MNFLAHLHLADPEPGLLLGGIVADFARPAEIATLPPEVQDGVNLHRLVDSFTDSHPIVRQSVARLSPDFHWFSGIIIDVYFDHILACQWNRYSLETLESFANRCYAALQRDLPLMPEEAAGFIRWMIDDNRLVRYATREGIHDTLARLSRRIQKRMPKNAIRLEDAIALLEPMDADITCEFHAFYPELIAFAAQVRKQHGWM